MKIEFGILANKSPRITCRAAVLLLLFRILEINLKMPTKQKQFFNLTFDRDHDGSILNNPSSSALEREQEGGSI